MDPSDAEEEDITKQNILNWIEKGEKWEFDFTIPNIVEFGASLEYEGQAKIEHFAIYTDYRGKGIASKIIETFIEYCLENQIHIVKAQIACTSEATKKDRTAKFLRSKGFKELEVEKHYQHGPVIKGKRKVY